MLMPGSWDSKIKGVQASNQVIDWILGFEHAFLFGLKNAAGNDQRLQNISYWYKMADRTDESVSKDINPHLWFNE